MITYKFVKKLEKVIFDYAEFFGFELVFYIVIRHYMSDVLLSI